MPEGFNIATKGFDELLNKLKKAPKLIQDEVDGVFEAVSSEFASRARRDAPKDVGFLAGEINYARKGPLKFSIASQSRYAGYLEFGTKKKFQNIPGFEDVAAQLKGKGEGSYKEGLENITQWVKRKGIRIPGATLEGTAYVIFRAILRDGIKAQPYFFKQVEPAVRQLETDLKNIVKALD